jgi:tellurite resistance protein TerC
VFVLGMSVVIVGIAMIVLPGPATIVIPAGLAILATEFVWAKRWLDYLKQRAQQAMEWTANSVGGSDISGKNEDQSSTASRQ